MTWPIVGPKTRLKKVQVGRHDKTVTCERCQLSFNYLDRILRALFFLSIDLRVPRKTIGPLAREGDEWDTQPFHVHFNKENAGVHSDSDNAKIFLLGSFSNDSGGEKNLKVALPWDCWFNSWAKWRYHGCRN